MAEDSIGKPYNRDVVELARAALCVKHLHPQDRSKECACRYFCSHLAAATLVRIGALNRERTGDVSLYTPRDLLPDVIGPKMNPGFMYEARLLIWDPSRRINHLDPVALARRHHHQACTSRGGRSILEEVQEMLLM